jgi:hypothetical protein
LRRITGQNRIDVSQYEEFVVHKRFPQSERLLAHFQTKDKRITSKWSRYLKLRVTNFAVRERFMIGSPGTNLFACYSNPPRVFPNMIISLCGLSEEEAKIWSLWFNSSLNFMQVKKVCELC